MKFSIAFEYLQSVSVSAFLLKRLKVNASRIGTSRMASSFIFSNFSNFSGINSIYYINVFSLPKVFMSCKNAVDEKSLKMLGERDYFCIIFSLFFSVFNANQCWKLSWKRQRAFSVVVVVVNNPSNILRRSNIQSSTRSRPAASPFANIINLNRKLFYGINYAKSEDEKRARRGRKLN